MFPTKENEASQNDAERVSAAEVDQYRLSDHTMTLPARHRSVRSNPQWVRIPPSAPITLKANGVVFQYSIARADDVSDTAMNSSGTVIPPAMGVAQAINFQPIGAGKVAITGDFVLLPNEELYKFVPSSIRLASTVV